jgi:tetratricopeptide (TPR) repeat protein
MPCLHKALFVVPPFMRHFTILISFLFLIGCKNATKKVNQTIHIDSSHNQEEKADKAFLEFQKVLDTLYLISDTNSKQALVFANRYINLYKDTIKKRGFSVSEVEDLHYLKGEIFYRLGMYRNSLNEFRATPVSGNTAIASNYMKLKMCDSAFIILSKEIPGHYLYNYEWANYYEMRGKKDSAIKLYRSILAEDWISNGHYETLKNNTKKRLDWILSNKEALTDLYFPTNNPKIRNSN